MTSAGSIAIDLTLNDRAFNKSVQNATKTADSAFTKSANNAEKAFTKSANNATNAFSKTANSTQKTFTSAFGAIGKVIASAFAVGAVVNFGKTCVQVASEAQAAWTGLNSIVQGTGNDFGKAQKFLTEYTKDGLVSISDAATAYKNLLARGYDTTQIENVMNALKNSAAFGRQSSYTLSQAVVSATEGLKNENSILVDNAGVTKNVAKMWDDYARSIGKSTSELTQQEKIQAEVNGILTETRFQAGDAATYTSTFAGKVAQLKAAFTSMKTAIGKVVAPIVGLFVPAITDAVNAVTSLFNKLAKFLSMFGLEFPDVVQKTTESTGAAARSIANIGDNSETAASKAKDAAKKIKKAFASVDEINVMSFGKDTSSGSSGSSGGSGSGGSGGSGGAGGSSGIAGAVEAVDTGNGAIDKAISKANELKDAFSEGFNIGWSGISFDEILGDLISIKDHLIDIFTAPEVADAASDWADNVMFAFGQVLGSAASIGVSLGTLLVGSVESYLSGNKDRITGFIVNMFDISGETALIVGNWSTALAYIAKVFEGQTAQNIGGNIIAMFTNPFMSVTELAAKFGRDVIDLIASPIIENQDKIRIALENTLYPLETLTTTISDALTFIGDKFNEVYDNYLAPFFDSLKNGISDTFGKFLDVYNEYVAPFLDNVGAMFKDTWDNHLKGVFDSALEFIGKVVDAVKVLWENWLKPIVDWIIQNVVPVVVPILENVGKTFKLVFDRIADVLGNFFDILGGIIDFIVGVFTGDWSRAWEGIKSIFTNLWDNIKGHFEFIWNFLKQLVSNKITEIKSTITLVFTYIKDYFSSIWNKIKDGVTTVWNGIKKGVSTAINAVKTTISNVLNGIKTVWDKIWGGLKQTVTDIFNGIWNTIKKVINSILGGIEGMANGVVNGINAVIKAMNRLSFDIPDWVPGMGGKKFGFDISELKKVSIPRLYEGAYFQRNNPTLAVVGDNRTQGEFVAPESKLKQSVKDAIEELGGNYNNENLKFDFNIKITTDTGREIIKKINDVTIQDGKVTLLV